MKHGLAGMGINLPITTTMRSMNTSLRNSCGTYDICPMQKYLIEGADAEVMLNRMVTRDIKKLKKGRVTYVCWCTDEGRLIDDGTIFKLAEKNLC